MPVSVGSIWVYRHPEGCWREKECKKKSHNITTLLKLRKTERQIDRASIPDNRWGFCGSVKGCRDQKTSRTSDISMTRKGAAVQFTVSPDCIADARKTSQTSVHPRRLIGQVTLAIDQTRVILYIIDKLHLDRHLTKYNLSLSRLAIRWNLFLHGVCMLRECIYSECAHGQHVRRTLTLTHTITAVLNKWNVVRVRILIFRCMKLSVKSNWASCLKTSKSRS